MPMRQSLMGQLHSYKKGGVIDIGMLQQAIHVDSSQLIKLTMSKSGEQISWPVAVVSPASGSKVSDSASAGVLAGLFLGI